MSFVQEILNLLLPFLAWLLPVGVGIAIGRYIYTDYFRNYEWGFVIIIGGPLLAWYVGAMIKGASLVNLIEVPLTAVLIGVLSAIRGVSLSKKGAASWYFKSCYTIAFTVGLIVPALPE